MGGWEGNGQESGLPFVGGRVERTTLAWWAMFGCQLGGVERGGSALLCAAAELAFRRQVRLKPAEEGLEDES